MTARDLPGCCFPTDELNIGEQLYCYYNRAGDPETAGLNYQGTECPLWLNLPGNIRAKWMGAAQRAIEILSGLRDTELATSELNFGQAIEALKTGQRVCRTGRNGKGMFLMLNDPEDLAAVPNAPGETCGMPIHPVDPCIWMKTAGNTWQPGWLASQADMLANDWMIVE